MTTQGLTAAEWARIKMDRPMSDLISDLAEELEFRKDTSVGIPTGFDGWDDRLGGLYPGELVSVVGLTNDFAAPRVVVDGCEEFVLRAADGPATGDHVVAIRAAAEEMGFALVIAGRLRGESTDWDAAIDEVPEDLAHYPDVVLARAKSVPTSTDWNVTSLKLTVVKHRTASPKATRTLRLERRGRYGWNVDQTADVSFGRSLRPIWPTD